MQAMSSIGRSRIDPLAATNLKRVRPKLSLGIDAAQVLKPKTCLDKASSPTSSLLDNDDYTQFFSAIQSDSPVGHLSSLNGLNPDSDGVSDDLANDLARLEELRRRVEGNLILRPIGSASKLRNDAVPSNRPTSPPSETLYDFRQHRTLSRGSSGSTLPSPALSVYFTPTTGPGTPLSALFVGNGNSSGSTGSASASASPPSPHPAQDLKPDDLFQRLGGTKRPLLIDTRPAVAFDERHIQHSLNIAIPSLIIKRCRKPGGGFHSLDALHTYIRTERGKELWNELMKPGGSWDGNVVIYDEEMNEADRMNPQSLAWTLISLLEPLIHKGSVEYLKGGFSAALSTPESSHRIIFDGRDNSFLSSDANSESRSDPPMSSRRAGLFQLDTLTAARSKAMPAVEIPSISPSGLTPPPPQNMLYDLSPSPSPSQLAFCTTPNQSRRLSVAGLSRLDTSSKDRLVPKLHVRTVPTKSQTLGVFSLNEKTSSSSLRANSPSYLNLSFSNLSGSSLSIPGSMYSSSELLSPSAASFRSASPSTPGTSTTHLSTTPITARPDDAPPSTEDPLPTFTISTILPNFLFLGPDLTQPEHVEELQALGVKRIISLAAECDDDQGLHLRKTFERYTRIPMRDTVEEENVTRRMREACEVLDDARLHSAPIYVHCKAGKSRSVTAVIAYLIHANHWTLSRAYAYVVERRKGISPNIGFVSELMLFEEQELGGKSVGVVSRTPSSNGDGDEPENSRNNTSFGYAVSGRRPGNIRESLPPAFHTQNSDTTVSGQRTVSSPGPSSADAVGDSRQEMEIKDANGRYRHIRRPPVDEATLQPLRRVSKAGLESSSHSLNDP